jgi:molybdopterin molybdotransferase
MAMDTLIHVNEAEALIAARLPSFGSERVPLGDAAGRILRQAVDAECDHPSFDRVMMDGIAIRWRAPLPTGFRLAGAGLAGMTKAALPAEDACLEVTTGAMLPAGCDCVIPVEQTRREGDHYLLADGYRPVRGQFIHVRGSDCVAGTRVLAAGVRIGAPEVAQLAANGVARVEVATVPSVAIVATGDELVAVDAPLGEGQVRRSNDSAVAAALRLHGIDRVSMGWVADDLPSIRAMLDARLAGHDVLILSGGVSMGQRDHVPRALEELGVRKVFHRIAQRPGKPMWFGIGPRGQSVYALPGNPVSALVCTVRYVRPALLAAMGLAPAETEHVCLTAPVARHAALTCFVPVRVHCDGRGSLRAQSMPTNTSGDFTALAGTHGVVQLPPGQGDAPAGTPLPLYRW